MKTYPLLRMLRGSSCWELGLAGVWFCRSVAGGFFFWGGGGGFRDGWMDGWMMLKDAVVVEGIP